MDIEFKKDLDMTKKRLQALWDHEIIDRVCISAIAPLDPSDPYVDRRPDSPEDLKLWYTDTEWILKRNLERFRKSYFAGDALPSIFPYFGTGGHARYVAPEENIMYSKDTIWFKPCIDDITEFDFEFDASTNKIFQQELQTTKDLCKEGMGRFFVANNDNCGTLDGLSQLRNPQELVVDLLDEPEAVQDAIRKLDKVLIETGDLLFEARKENNMGGSIHQWMNTWSKGKHAQMQCDTAVMLSRSTFDEFLIDELTETSQWLDNAIYHMDGIEQIRHLDTLLSIPTIDMIQWVQVYGQPPCTEFIPELKRIQAAGKGIMIEARKDQVKTLLDNLSPRGLNLTVVDAASKEEADAIVDFALKYPYRKEDMV